ncbi:hypothetical protein [Nocardia wallacei]|uniref:hypothetical protein n=1 Tax=Nocardia wallacei TaxID=480035 RepID=UPI002457CCE9|nr:hypothetical protein [Nocardia wallacei]
MVTAAPIVPTMPALQPAPQATPTRAGRPARRPLPLIEVHERPVQRLRYALRPIDSQGRICDRHLPQWMGWLPGQRLRWICDHGLLLLSVDSDGPARVTRNGYLRVPAQFQRQAAVTTGDRLLFVAIDHTTTLFVIPRTVFERVVTDSLTESLGGDFA